MTNNETVAVEQVKAREVAAVLGLDIENLDIREVNGGHMGYIRRIVADEESEFFIKDHDDTRFTDEQRRMHSRQYLDKEAAYMRHIVGEKAIVPKVHGLIDDALVLDCLSEENGWYWRAPENEEQKQAYIEDVLQALTSVEVVDVIDDKLSDTRPALEIFLKDGWQIFDSKKAKITKKAAGWRDRLGPDSQQYFGRFVTDMLTVNSKMVAQNLADIDKKSTLSHHDARQANIAWHP